MVKIACDSSSSYAIECFAEVDEILGDFSIVELIFF